ncbi:MAG: hypothetical protein LBO03_09265 [Acidaminococcales bacterium]|jgi:hypothetical protein|nr:hypothetical protein [Acidaminococcales bacterium]
MPEFLKGTITDIGIAQNVDKLHRDIIEFQKQTNPILEEMVLQQCNSGTVHKAALRTALPAVAWRMLNKGIKPGKSGKRQETFTCGQMMAMAQIDEDEVVLNGGDEYRLAENRAFQIQMNNTMARTLFYGDEKVNPAGFTGLGAYYYSLVKANCEAADYVFDAGGTGSSLTSLWFVVWDAATIHGIFPQNTKAGFEYRDNGRVKAYDDAGAEYYVLEAQYKWYLGLAVKDYRYASRVANIDVTAANAGFLDLLIAAYNRLENVSLGKAAIYCNRSVKTLLDKLAQSKANVNLSVETYAGKPTTQFWGIPVRVCDGILNAESQVV